jgi:hypothetical protein
VVLLLLPDPIVQSVLRTARDSVSDENEHRASQSTKPVDQASRPSQGQSEEESPRRR